MFWFKNAIIEKVSKAVTSSRYSPIVKHKHSGADAGGEVAGVPLPPPPY